MKEYTPTERAMMDKLGLVESDFEKNPSNEDRIEELEAMLEALLEGRTE